ncbi:hypothetical protein E2562_015144 [Oryza meyeriana var. granulata]|uniref:Uncharacterized protein n=1 Tax=Oryza meyeriana var. granulata TaxID=110450 RepID=A0A6G1DWW2_9ORYZ|nr:hypothetical protein E2562_015144 [Oryza meyeriana var. granulata]
MLTSVPVDEGQRGGGLGGRLEGGNRVWQARSLTPLPLSPCLRAPMASTTGVAGGAEVGEMGGRQRD